MDDVVNRFARELADAIAAAVAENPQVEACREKARAAGFEMKVTLEAVVGFVSRSQSAALTKVTLWLRRVWHDSAGPLRSPPTIGGSFGRFELRQTKRPKKSKLTVQTQKARVQQDEGRSRRGPAFFIVGGLVRALLRCRRRSGRAPRGRRDSSDGRLEPLVELVDEGNTGRNVELGDVRFRDIVQIFHKRTQAVAMRGNQDTPAGSIEGAMVVANPAESVRPYPLVTRCEAVH